jgi:hypothetical protein
MLSNKNTSNDDDSHDWQGLKSTLNNPEKIFFPGSYFIECLGR